MRTLLGCELFWVAVWPTFADTVRHLYGDDGTGCSSSGEAKQAKKAVEKMAKSEESGKEEYQRRFALASAKAAVKRKAREKHLNSGARLLSMTCGSPVLLRCRTKGCCSIGSRNRERH